MRGYEKVKAWRALNPDKVAEQDKRYAQKHPETNKRAKAKYREHNLERIREMDKLAARRKRAADPEAQKRRSEAYRIRQEQKKAQVAGRSRPSLCDICGEDAMGIICFDHCHATNAFRGWICDRCNKALGLVKDDPKLLDRMITYLENHYVRAKSCRTEQAS